jgi:hypothetical protein
MSAPLKPISDEYLSVEHRIRPGDRFHRLVARMTDMWFDDLTDNRIEELERRVDEWRWMNANGERI